jgi:hypothetical protein
MYDTKYENKRKEWHPATKPLISTEKNLGARLTGAKINLKRFCLIVPRNRWRIV